MLSKQTVDHVNGGGVIAYPTSTLPGLACLPNAAALDRLFELKQRSADKPVSLGVLSLDQAEALVHVPQKSVCSKPLFQRAASPSSSTPQPRLTHVWAASVWPFAVLRTPPLGNWSRPSGPSRPPAPTNQAKHLQTQPRKPVQVWVSLRMPFSPGVVPVAWEAPFST